MAEERQPPCANDGPVHTSLLHRSAVPWTLARWSTLGMLEPARATSELALAAVMSPLVAPRASAIAGASSSSTGRLANGR